MINGAGAAVAPLVGVPRTGEYPDSWAEVWPVLLGVVLMALLIWAVDRVVSRFRRRRGRSGR